MRNATYQNQVIAKIDDMNKVIYKNVQLSKHLFKKFDAFGIDYDLLNSVPSDYKIEIFETEQEKRYITTVEKFKKVGKILHFKGKKDYGTQVFLARQEFEIK